MTHPRIEDLSTTGGGVILATIGINQGIPLLTILGIVGTISGVLFGLSRELRGWLRWNDKASHKEGK